MGLVPQTPFCCICFLRFPRGPYPLSFSSLSQSHFLLFRFAPHFKHIPLQAESHIVLMVISKWTKSLICFEMSISFTSGGKWSLSSQSIHESSSSPSSSSLSLDNPENELALSLPNVNPRSMTSGSSTGSSVSNSEKLEKMLSPAGSPHLQTHRRKKI